MAQSLEEFVRGTPFAREGARLRLIETTVMVFLAALDRDEGAVAAEMLTSLRELTGRKDVEHVCPKCGRSWFRPTRCGDCDVSSEVR